jgi:hypothetical protein
VQSHHFAKQALGPITNNSIADPLAYRKAETAVLQTIPTSTEYYHPIRTTAPLTMYAPKIGGSGEAVLQGQHANVLLVVPLFVFRIHGQRPASLCTPRLEHLASTLGGHALTKTMNLLTTTFLWLPRSLGHFI